MHLQVISTNGIRCSYLADSSEFTQHQRDVFCVFSGQGVNGLRDHLNRIPEAGFSTNDDDDDQTMTGMMGALNAGDDDADGDEELEDVEGGVSFRVDDDGNTTPHEN